MCLPPHPITTCPAALTLLFLSNQCPVLSSATRLCLPLHPTTTLPSCLRCASRAISCREWTPVRLQWQPACPPYPQCWRSAEASQCRDCAAFRVVCLTLLTLPPLPSHPAPPATCRLQPGPALDGQLCSAGGHCCTAQAATGEHAGLGVELEHSRLSGRAACPPAASCALPGDCCFLPAHALYVFPASLFLQLKRMFEDLKPNVQQLLRSRRRWGREGLGAGGRFSTYAWDAPAPLLCCCCCHRCSAMPQPTLPTPRTACSLTAA